MVEIHLEWFFKNKLNKLNKMDNSSKIRVRWFYNRPITKCIISTNGITVATGVSKQHKEDNFVKIIGRQKAFKKAMNEMKQKVSRETRTTLWSNFKKTVKTSYK